VLVCFEYIYINRDAANESPFDRTLLSSLPVHRQSVVDDIYYIRATPAVVPFVYISGQYRDDF